MKNQGSIIRRTSSASPRAPFNDFVVHVLCDGQVYLQIGIHAYD